MSPSRRDFIRNGCCAAAAFGVAASFERFSLLSALAQSPSNYRALVCIFLFGGNDGNNLIAPIVDAGIPAGFRYSDYLAIRGDQSAGGLALPISGAGSLLPITAATAQPSGVRDFGLHPSLVQSQGLFNLQRVAVVANMGMLNEPLTRAEYLNRSKPRPANLFSHSDQQQQWQTSHPDGFGVTGWAGRTADYVNPIFNTGAQYPPITTVAGTVIFCTGSQTSPFALAPTTNPASIGLAVSGRGSAEANARVLSFQQLLGFDTGISLVQSASSITGAALQQSAALSAALQGISPLQTVFPSTSIGNQLAQVARILKARTSLDANLQRQIFFCSMGGYDTHTGQIADQANLLAQLDAAMKAFYDATLELNISSDVTTFTLSEFGRALKPASGAGSDHGWGGHQLVMGGAVLGGDVYGRMPEMALSGPDDSSSSGRWIPTTSVDQFGATLARWFGVPDAHLPAIFPNLPNFPQQTLPFL
jgi:uncharacterized protein (DUF1501 family)